MRTILAFLTGLLVAAACAVFYEHISINAGSERHIDDAALNARIDAAVNAALKNMKGSSSSTHASQSKEQCTGKSFPTVKHLPVNKRKRILVTGGAGFVGSHLVDRLMEQGHIVTVADNYFTGHRRNVDHWHGHPNFELITHDIVYDLTMEVNEIYHLACPASPVHYMANPIKTMKTAIFGTHNMLGLAKRTGARMLLASTSEVYGDPQIDYQDEQYWGNVNSFGPRSCYDEGKRSAESLSYSYQERDGVDVRIARIFNTYGPRMNINDGRVVSNFIVQALQGHPITVYGEGTQTRSFQYVDDLTNGLMQLMASNYSKPVNIGNPDERTILNLAQTIIQHTNSSSEIVYENAVIDDPKIRRPNIDLAKRVLEWEPRVPLSKGLKRTIEYFKQELETSN